MKRIFEDPLCGILIAISGCLCGLGIFIYPDSTACTVALILQMIFLGLFFFRLIRIWRKRENNPPAAWIPALKFADAALWLIVLIIWWNEVNDSDDFLGIGMMIILMIHAAREIYEAAKMLLMKR
jgi:hypothetical protein